MAGLSEPGFAEKVQGPIDGRQTQVGVLLGQLVVHLLGRDVFLFEEGAQDQLTLTGQFELMPGEVLLERLNLFCVLGHRAGLPSDGMPLKDKFRG